MPHFELYGESSKVAALARENDHNAQPHIVSPNFSCGMLRHHPDNLTVQATGAEAILTLIREQKGKVVQERAKRDLDPEFKLRKKDLPSDNTSIDSTIAKQASKTIRGLGHTEVIAFIDNVAPPSVSTFI